MNVGILAFVTCWVLRRLWVSDLVASAITVVLAVAYALLTDVGAPIWRATLMLALYLGARLLYRDKSMLNAIGAAALGLLVLNPQVLFGASFQLTFLCPLLIVTVGVPILERTSQPYHRGLMYLDSTRYDVSLSPKIAQSGSTSGWLPAAWNISWVRAFLCLPWHACFESDLGALRFSLSRQ